MSKLNEQQAKEIYFRASCGEKHTDIAKDYGIGYKNVNLIARGKTWKILGMSPLTRNSAIVASKNMDLHKRLESSIKIDPITGCHVWQRPNISGYGQISWRGKVMRAHRVSYILNKGKISKGKMILHSCDNPSCINPKHLRQGTARDNHEDKLMRGRAAWAVGMKAHNAILNDEQVNEIFKRLCTGERVNSVALTFGVQKQVVSAIKRGRTWGHLTVLKKPLTKKQKMKLHD